MLQLLLFVLPVRMNRIRLHLLDILLYLIFLFFGLKNLMVTAQLVFEELAVSQGRKFLT